MHAPHTQYTRAGSQTHALWRTLHASDGTIVSMSCESTHTHVRTWVPWPQVTEHGDHADI